MLERIVNKRLVNYLDKNCIITEYQYGFGLKRSCETQLLCILHDWCQILDTGCSLDVSYLDISCGFNMVSHNKLLQKLISVGMKGEHLKWIRSF